MEGLTDVDSQVSYWIRRLGKAETEHSRRWALVQRWAAAEEALQAANEAASADFQADLMSSQGAIDAKHKPTVWQMRREHDEATAAVLEAVKETQQ